MRDKKETADKDHLDKKNGIRWIYKRLRETKEAAHIYHQIMHMNIEGAKDTRAKIKDSFL